MLTKPVVGNSNEELDTVTELARAENANAVMTLTTSGMICLHMANPTPFRFGAPSTEEFLDAC